jgi:hypothetical protein
MNEKTDGSLLAGTEKLAITSRRTLARTRWVVVRLAISVGVGMWLGGGADRYGEQEGIVGSVRGACRTIAKSGQYAAATLLDVVFQQRSSVRKLGLAQQVETRLWQDKRLVADQIVVEIEEEGTAVLRGLVPDLLHKEMAVSLAQDTRGVARVVDQLAVSPASRVIETKPAAAVPTGVASGVVIHR